MIEPVGGGTFFLREVPLVVRFILFHLEPFPR
jgi:hypothetical protein